MPPLPFRLMVIQSAWLPAFPTGPCLNQLMIHIDVYCSLTLVQLQFHAPDIPWRTYSLNNYAGFSQGWEAGGAKSVKTRNLVVRGNYSHHKGPGLWTETTFILYTRITGLLRTKM